MSDIFWVITVFVFIIIPVSLGFYADRKAKIRLESSRKRLDNWNH